MYAFLRPILNKGGAGLYISRAETAERLRPLQLRHLRLLRAYDDALARLADRALAGRLGALLPDARTELAKLNETVHSVGGAAAYGTAYEPGQFDPGRTDEERLFNLLDEERDYNAALAEEMDAVHHQERTRAILTAVGNGGAKRLDALREVTSRMRRPR